MMYTDPTYCGWTNDDEVFSSRLRRGLPRHQPPAGINIPIIPKPWASIGAIYIDRLVFKVVSQKIIKDLNKIVLLTSDAETGVACSMCAPKLESFEGLRPSPSGLLVSSGWCLGAWLLAPPLPSPIAASQSLLLPYNTLHLKAKVIKWICNVIDVPDIYGCRWVTR